MLAVYLYQDVYIQGEQFQSLEHLDVFRHNNEWWYQQRDYFFGLLRNEKNKTDEERVAMIVNKSGLDGTGMRLKDFERDNINKLKTLIYSVINPLVTTKY